MLYKWANFCSSIYRSVSVYSLLLCLVSFLGFSVPGYSLITLEPISGGSQAGSVQFVQSTPYLQATTKTFYYYVGVNPPALPNFIDFDPIDLTQTLDDGISAGSFKGILNFNFTSNTTATAPSNQQMAIILQAYPAGGGGTPRTVSIATVNGQFCSDSICTAKSNYRSNLSNGPRTNNTHYYAARYTPSGQREIQIGFYPTELCKDFPFASGNNGVGTAVGCNSGTDSTVTLPTSGTLAQLQVNFSVVTLATTDATVALPATLPAAVDTLPTPLNIAFSVDVPKFVCPTDSLARSYYPGDEQIFLNTGLFTISSQSGGGALVPGDDLFVVGKTDDSTPDVGTGFKSANSLMTEVPIGSLNQSVGGFTNSDDAGNPHYNLSFIVRDRAGVYAPPTDATTCQITNVQTGAVEGFLAKSNCFIATAAFRSGEAEPVELLRGFRDQVLLKHSLGRAFVDWYYDWSPSRAKWLMQNPGFRFPVVLGLIPLQLFAWVLLNPLWFFLGGGLCLGSFLLCRWRLKETL